ncbi:MAG TPA: LAGLIDADG family homing endonuclease, partial [Candidatus Acidoferrum sp.]|nr:LAGLIDADG family homing endonuclease [Candidatus Acidoferrum sp.]
MASLRRILQDGEAISSKATSENGAQIYIGAAWLARWVVNEFGRSHQKQIPDWVWTAGIPFCNGLLRGYFDGDGWIEADNNNVKAKSVCQQLILQTRDLVASLGYGWSSIYYHKPKPGIPNRKENWEIVLSGPTGHEYRRRWAIEKKPRLKQARHWRYAEKGRFVDLQIEAVADGFSESFYDLEVDDASHSFTTPQCCVHNCAHISEVCDYPNPKALIEEGLFKAVHTSRKVFLVLESTGNGNTGWWPDTWRSSKEFYPLGRARLFPLFLPWFVGTDIYPKRDWLQKFPIPDNWMPGPDTVKHAIKCMAYVRNTPILRKILGEDWELPREQAWFWEFNFEEARRKNAAKEWLRQMPADDTEALSGKNDKIFGEETIQVISECRKQNYDVYGIIGEGIDEKFEPDPAIVDYNKPRFDVEWKTPRGVELQWLFLPLKPIDDRDENTAMAKLLVFEHPLDGVDYSMAGDTSDGVGGDRSVIDVNRIGPIDGPDIQAAEFCSDEVSTVEAAHFMAAIAAYYAPKIPNYKMPTMAIEQRRKPGDDCQNQLIRIGFWRHFKFHRLDGKNPEKEERQSNRLGWYTNEWSRPYMFGRLIDSIENGWQIVNSPFCIRELEDVEKKYTASGKGRMEHMQGKHDDRVFARGIAYTIAHTRDVRMEKEK